MHRLTLVTMAAVALAGCAGAPVTPLTSSGADALRGRNVVVLAHEKPSFGALTVGTGALIGGALGGAMAIAEGNRIASENAIDDPAPRIARALVAELEESHGVRFAGTTSADAQDLDRLARINPGADYLLDVRTQGWGFMYFPTAWNHYRVHYFGRLQLVDLKRKTVVAEGACRRLPEESANSPTYDELLAANAAFIKSELQSAADLCLESYRTQTFLLASRAPANSPSAASVSPPIAVASAPAPTATATRTPLPADVSIVVPGVDVPARRAAFSGTWTGQWAGGPDHTLVVEKVGPDAASVIYSWGVSRRIPNPGFVRTGATFVEGDVLKARLASGAEVSYALSADLASLDAQYVRDGRLFRGKFERR